MFPSIAILDSRCLCSPWSSPVAPIILSLHRVESSYPEPIVTRGKPDVSLSWWNRDSYRNIMPPRTGWAKSMMKRAGKIAVMIGKLEKWQIRRGVQSRISSRIWIQPVRRSVTLHLAMEMLMNTGWMPERKANEKADSDRCRLRTYRLQTKILWSRLIRKTEIEIWSLLSDSYIPHH